jgi:CBS domain-containing protein
MPRTDIHLDSMLRHLGAAYYESLHGRASRADVTRALDTVEEHLHEESKPSQSGVTPPPGLPVPRARRLTRRVADVMTTSVVTVDRLTPYKDIVRLLTEHRISGVPVLSMGRHVVGVVTEADLLTEEDKTARDRMASPGRFWRRPPRRWALTAGELMTSPAVTIHPDATIPRAARTMNAHHIRRLPVIDEDGRLLGVVSRRDLLGVFLRPDGDIAREVRQVFDEALHDDPASVTTTVKNGVVVLTGHLEADPSLVAVAIRLAWGVDGVVDVVDRRHGFSGEASTASGATESP